MAYQGFDFGIGGYKTRTNPDIHAAPLIRATFSQSTGQNQLRAKIKHTFSWMNSN